MAAPNLARRTTVFVAKIGTNDAGANVVGAPQARLTIAQALADLASMYQPATIDDVKVISIEPGRYALPACELPPNVFIEADPDAEGGSNGQVVLVVTGNVSLSSDWQNSTDAIGGFRGVTLEAATGIEEVRFDLPSPPSGNPVRRLVLQDVTLNVTFSAVATQDTDILEIRDCVLNNTAASFVTNGFNLIISGLRTAIDLIFNDNDSIPATINASGIYGYAAPSNVAPGVQFNALGAGIDARLGFCDVRNLFLNLDGGDHLFVYADAVSIPLAGQITYAGTAATTNLIRTTDTGAFAGGVGVTMGSFVMAGGAKTVADAAVTANSVVSISRKTASGAATGTFLITTTAGVGFVVAGGAATDNGTYNYAIIG